MSGPSDDGGGNDATGRDAMSDAGGDTSASQPDGNTDDGSVIPTPAGTKLAAASAPEVLGITSDGYVVYFDFPRNTLYAADTSGQAAGSPIRILDTSDAGGMDWYAVVSGQVVFAWAGLAGSGPSVGPLTVWSKATGAHSIAGSTLAGFGVASGDGSHIVYAATGGTSATGDITAAATDGTNAAVLVSGAELVGQPSCLAQASFVGTGLTDALVAYCLPTDAATTGATLDAFSGASWTKTTLATGLKPSNPNLLPLAAPVPQATMGNVYVLDATSTNILAVTAANDAIAIAYPAANPSSLQSGADTPAYFIGNGGTLSAVYTTQAGAVNVTTIPAGTPATLVSSGATFIYPALSPDGKWGVYADTTSSTGGVPTSDLTLFATSLPGATKSVTATADAALGAGSVFTADSTHLLWYDAFTADSYGFYETLHATDVMSGSSVVVGQKVWMALASAGGTKVVYNDNPSTISSDWPSGMEVVEDIEIVDVAATPPAPKLLQKGADATFLLTPDLKTVIYAFGQGSQSGVYAIPAQ